MKKAKKQLNTTAIIISLLVLLQSCSVYKSDNLTLDQAVQNESRVKVKTINNEKYKFKRIEIADGHYYGVKKVKGKDIKVPLNRAEVSKINEKNKSLSTILTIASPIIITTAFLVGIANSNWNYNLNFSGQ